MFLPIGQTTSSTVSDPAMVGADTSHDHRWGQHKFGQKKRREHIQSRQLEEEEKQQKRIICEEKREDEQQEEEEDSEEDRGGDANSDDAISAEELSALHQKMSTLPLAKLNRLKTELGDVLFQKALYGESVESEKKVKKATTSSQIHNSIQEKGEVWRKKKGAKHPREESSKRPPPKLRQLKGVQLKKAKNARFDPRFSVDCGEFDEVAFHRDYAFLDEYRQKDMKELKKAYKEAKREQNQMKADRIKRNLLRLQNQQKTNRDQRLMEQVRAELRKTNIERMNSGQPPIYLNNYELKERFLERKRELCGGEHGTSKMMGRRGERKEQANKGGGRQNWEEEGKKGEDDQKVLEKT